MRYCTDWIVRSGWTLITWGDGTPTPGLRELSRGRRRTGHRGIPAAGDEDDQAFGSAGRDQMTGGGGDDRLAGGSGEDVGIGGPGHDVLGGIEHARP
ncbi:hypothetical protein [Nocardioides panacisoli]|uniref:Calcium-binding protein n=1 Tax=Nocardioides panacisoli TaxID=627624 RepID=A0ABP7IHW4_9ACTN